MRRRGRIRDAVRVPFVDQGGIMPLISPKLPTRLLDAKPMTTHPRLLFAVVSTAAFLAPTATAAAKLASNHSETLLIDA
jgi:hypothetical protein